MASHQSRRVIERLGAGAVAAAVALMAAAVVTADAPGPATILVASQSGSTVSVSGTWAWAEMATAAKLSYAGYAISWGDVTSGNAIGSYHIGDGTAATNIVFQPTSPAQGASGSWGPVSHTFAGPGTYSVCVIVYDLGQVKPFKTTGYHSLQAGGIGRNIDNSVDQRTGSGAACVTVSIGAPTASATEPSSPSNSPSPAASSPFSSFQGETAGPSAPATGTDTASSDESSPLVPIALVVLFGLSSVLAFGRVKAR